MREVELNGTVYALKIHQEKPELPYLLMLHGFMGDSRVFDELAELISKSCNPITPDLLGHGQTQKRTDPGFYREENQTADLRKLIRKLDAHRLFLYGYSMGGRLALKVALDNPKPLRGLILESAHPGIADPTERSDRRAEDEERANRISNDYEAFLEEWEQLPLFQSPLPIPPKLGKKYRNIHLEQHPGAMAASLRGFGTGSMTPVGDRIPEFDKPAMVVAGSEDEKYIEISRSMAGFFEHTYLCHIVAGHRVHRDNPKSLAGEINKFINKHS